MLRYSLTIFLSAFLLFQIQPMIARYILPWFGGTAAVWTACMMFFQFSLMLGYAYSHLLRLKLSPRAAWLLHTAVLVAAAFFSHITPGESLAPQGNENMTFAIVKLLTLTIGLPFFVLSTTGPLIQAWQSTSHPSRSPYRLYALSNLGSMLALLSYPFLLERYLPLAVQAQIWSLGFLVFCGLCCLSGWQAARKVDWGGEQEFEETDFGASTVGGDRLRGQGNKTESNRQPWRPFVWVLLAMVASVMLLGTTNLMCQEVASVPFLWILPLSLYLLSFIICFDRPDWYRRRIFSPLLAVSAMAAIAIVHLNVYAGLMFQISSLALVCFAASMTCHGELERLKPRPHQLTWFYLLVSAGGALGGLFAAVVAPHWFTGFYEFELALLICLLVPLLVLFFEQREPNERSLTVIARWASMLMTSVAAAFAFCSLLFRLDPAFHQDLVYRARNEYGLVAIIEKNDQVIFVNGRIEHGAQHKDSKRSLEHNSYYLPGTGVEIATESFRQFLKATGEKRGLLVGVLGLGAGGMMTWSQPDDHFVFYEINPEVEKIANTFFTYLKDSPGESEVVLGDGRLQLERRAKRLATDKNNNSSLEPFDLLFMDAFASDSIPLHLLTAECFDVYCDNIKPEGILIAHISNRFVDLRPVIYQQAIDHDLTPILVNVAPLDGGRPSLWVLMTRNQKIVNSNWIQRNESPWPENMPLVRWTDDHASLAGVLDWSGGIDIEQILEQRKKK